MRVIFQVSALVLAGLGCGTAQAADFSFDYSFDNVVASGIFSGADQGNGSYLITNASGTRTVGLVATAITGIAPVGTGSYTDNLLYPLRAVPLNFSGVTYNLASGNQINLYGSAAYANVREFIDFGVELPAGGSFTVKIQQLSSAVPEPATWAMMFAGFGIVGGTMRRRKTSVVFA